MSERYFQTRGSLRAQCGFSELDFDILWRHVRGDLNDPENIIGLEGPKKHKEAWHAWVERYINGGLAAQYWGEGTERKWDLTTNAEEIVGFLLLFLKHAAQANRAAAVFVKVKQESIDSYVMAGSSPERADLLTSPTTHSENAEIPATQGCSIKRKAIDSLPSRLLLTKDSSPEDSDHTQGRDVKAAPTLGRGEKFRHRNMLKREVESTPGPAKKARFSLGRRGFGLSPNSIHLRPAISLEVGVSPTKKSSPSARIRTETPPTPPSEPSERVFETKIAGTNQLRIIYAVQAPTLAQFIGKVYEKYSLGPQQRVSGIDVWVGSDFISIDLEEEKDWAYITSCVVMDDVRIKVVVWIV